MSLAPHPPKRALDSDCSPSISAESSSPPPAPSERERERERERRDSQSSDGDRSQSDGDRSFLSLQGRAVRDAPRKRRRTAPHELEVLEAEFQRNSRPGKADRERIARLTSMDEKAVQVWFQNKRQSHRRQHNLVTPAAVRTQSMPIFQDENAVFATASPSLNVNSNASTLFNHQPRTHPHAHTNAPLYTAPYIAPKFRMGNQVVYGSPPKGPKALRLAMSADGKAELIERSPLKSLSTNATTAGRFASMPSLPPPQNVTGIEQECASSLLVLKFGRWR